MNHWYKLFWKYVNSGRYQAFLRDLSKYKTPVELAEVNSEIRRVYLDRIRQDFIEFGSIALMPDNSTIYLQDDSFIRQLEPTFTRLMVGNHGAYIEFTEPEDKGHYIR